MKITASGISKGEVLPQQDVVYASGEVTLVAVEGGQRPSVLGLILSGRMAPDTGDVAPEALRHSRPLRDQVVLVDAPEVNAPDDAVALKDVLIEDLVYACPGGRVAAAKAARTLLADENAAEFARTAIHEVPAEVRVRLLCEAAVRHPGTTGLVLVAPDRHGGDPRDWYRVARSLADRGLAVVVLAGHAAVEIASGLFVEAPHLPPTQALPVIEPEPEAEEEQE
ncbi:MAG: hypothetical protein QM607_01585 [Microbacterium sp.]